MKKTSTNKPGRPRDPERMRKVIEAAAQQFLEQGFERTSMESVARSSGVSKMTIYSYFPTKSALFEAVIGQRTDRVFDLDGNEAVNPKLPKETLTIIGRRFLALMRDEEVIARHRIMFASAGVHEEACVAFLRQGPQKLIAQVKDYLDSAIGAGTLAPHDTEVAANQFLSLFLGEGHIKAMLGLGKPTHDEDQRLIDLNVGMFLRAYGMAN
ncbi:MAG: TetR/AcrR family transcriptional regulator [Methylococcales bacterium]|nr:TetR/AcrR family transcriptional regulator [Methylococcales bacterium]